MNSSGVRAITSFTFRESIRAKWLWIFSAVYFLVAINIPILFLLAVHLLPPSYLDQFLGNLVALTFPFIPLLSLPLGSTSIVDEKESGTLQYVLSNPISKSEFFFARSLGLLISTSAVILLGFGFAAIVAFSSHIAGYPTIGALMLLAAGLNVTMLAMALVISAFVKRKTAAIGIAIFVWFIFTVISDIGLLTLVESLNSVLSVIPVLLNPVEILTILAGIQLGGTPSLLGQVGGTTVYYMGHNTVTILLSSALVWIIVPVIAGFYIFSHQDLA